MKLGTETATKPSTCCECGHGVDRASGAGTPSAGDFTLCIMCASLNVFDDALVLRRPTDAELFEAAASPEVQFLRRVIRAARSRRAKA